MTEPNCEKCRYRYWISKYGGYVWGKDCDKYGQDLCKKMNNPDFIKWMDKRSENNE